MKDHGGNMNCMLLLYADTEGIIHFTYCHEIYHIFELNITSQNK